MPLNIITEQELLTVQKPAQYLGGERGSIVKNISEVDIRICLAFPDTYEVGMSHTGYQILYDLINSKKNFWAERAYTPLPDMEQLLRRKEAPLTSLESKTPLADFDIVGFSLQYELCMSGILTILDLGKIPLLASERNSSHPLIIGGGPVAYHPEPFADFFDCFLVGDGEELVPEFLEVFSKIKSLSRHQQLKELSKIKGVYIPSFFEPIYNHNGTFAGFSPIYNDYKSIERRVIASLEDAPYPRSPIVPNVKAVHDRLAVEVMRGCVRGCRFCQAGYLYRPQRERKPEEIRDIVKESLANTGFEELSLLSLSTADYCSILPLLKVLKDECADKDKVAISFPSTRVDALTPELLQEVQPIRRSGFTMAPEAGTQRLRDVINKGVTDQQIIDTCRNVFTLGWSSVKLYFMIGLPTETDEDILGIIDVARRIKQIAGRRNEVTISVSTHVPKPHTPFQWAAQIDEEETRRKQRLLSYELKRSKITFRYHDAKASVLEGIFARGDRRLGQVILKAYQHGTRLDGWVEELKYEQWMEAFDEVGINPLPYLNERAIDQPLPWDHISCDIEKRWFKKEWERAITARVTPDCLTKTCSTCGACDYDGVRNVLFDRQRTESRLRIVSPAWQPIIEAKQAGANNDQILDLLKQSVPAAAEANAKREIDGTYKLREYLKTEVNDKRDSLKRDNALVIQRIRLTYGKMGPMRFYSHLDLSAILFRAARMVDLPVVFSQGFNPRPKFAFGPPLQLGIESECEQVDILLFNEMKTDDVKDLLNTALPLGFRILLAVDMPLKATPIQALKTDSLYKAISNNKDELYKFDNSWASHIVERNRKGKITSVELGSYVANVTGSRDDFSFLLKADDSGSTLKPLEVVAALTGKEPLTYLVKKISVL